MSAPNEMDLRKFVNTDIERIVRVYQNAFTVNSGKHMTTVNELTDQIPASDPGVLWSAAQIICDLVNYRVKLGIDKVLTEEDKGSVLAGLVSVQLRTPLAMARCYPYKVPGSILVNHKMEYHEGDLWVNGLLRGDKVLIFDDTLSTGGTALALIEAVEAIGAEVAGMVVITEKLGYGGRDKLRAAGVDVRAGIGIRIGEDGVVRVAEIYERPIEEYRI